MVVSDDSADSDAEDVSEPSPVVSSGMETLVGVVSVEAGFDFPFLPRRMNTQTMSATNKMTQRANSTAIVLRSIWMRALFFSRDIEYPIKVDLLAFKNLVNKKPH